MTDSILNGTVWHQRFQPLGHFFEYPVTYWGFDLDDLFILRERPPLYGWGRPALNRFHRGDFLPGTDGDLADAARALVAQERGTPCTGSVYLITTLRSAGVMFNPVSFYIIRDQKSGDLEAIISEITNTPWRQRRAHVHLPDQSEKERGGKTLTFSFDKDFHISPFAPMDESYRWSFTLNPHRTVIHMDTHRDGHLVFTAHLSLAHKPATKANMVRAALTAPFAPARTLWRIYRQALALWLKGAKYHPSPHPRVQTPLIAGESS